MSFVVFKVSAHNPIINYFFAAKSFYPRQRGKKGGIMSKSTFKILFYIRKNQVNKDLIPFLKNIIRNFVLNTKRLERFAMRQGLGLVLKVKPFKLFTAIHNSKTWLVAKIEISINSHFLTVYISILIE